MERAGLRDLGAVRRHALAGERRREAVDIAARLKDIVAVMKDERSKH